jgi:hypothetical protein
MPPLVIRTRRGLYSVLLAVLVAVSCQYFFTGGGQNQATRFDLVRAIVESHTLTIDAYQENTRDKAQYGDHYYCDKAPGTSLAAVPFVAAVRWAASLAGVNPRDALAVEGRVATLVCATLPTAAATVAIYLLAMRLGGSAAAAAVAAVAYGLGTPAWAYGTLFWGNQLATACVLAAFAIARRMEAATSSATPGETLRFGFALGLAVGCAVVTEFSSVGAGGILIGWVLIRAWRDPGGRAGVLRIAAAVALGGLGPALVLGAYDQLAFGSPFHIGYGSVVGWEAMHRGAFGVTFPKIDVLYWLLFGWQKGLFLISPILMFGAAGLYLRMRDERYRGVATVMAAVFVFYLLFNASYHYWTGGWTYGPRFMAAGLPFLCLGLPRVWDRRGPARDALAFAAVLSIALTFIAVATHPVTPEGRVWPLRDIFLPSFFHGLLSLNTGQYFFSDAPIEAQNFGEYLGLGGLTSLLPLIAVWALLGTLWYAMARYESRLILQPSAATASPVGPKRGPSRAKLGRRRRAKPR